MFQPLQRMCIRKTNRTRRWQFPSWTGLWRRPHASPRVLPTPQGRSCWMQALFCVQQKASLGMRTDWQEASRLTLRTPSIAQTWASIGDEMRGIKWRGNKLNHVQVTLLLVIWCMPKSGYPLLQMREMEACCADVNRCCQAAPSEQPDDCVRPGRGILQKVVDANSQIEFHYEGSRDLIGHEYDARSVRFWLPPQRRSFELRVLQPILAPRRKSWCLPPPPLRWSAAHEQCGLRICDGPEYASRRSGTARRGAYGKHSISFT